MTVDLNGFQIAHTSGSGDGIQILGTALRCAIGNGSVTGFLGSGISGLARGGAIFHVSASNCSNGFSVDESWRIESCTALDNTFNGINTTSGAVISNCAASNNGGSGIAVGNGATIQASLAIGNRGFAGIATGNGCTLIQCTARGNTGANNSQSTGIFTGSGSTITACTADSNTSTSASTSGLNGSGISAGDNSKVQDCSASSNKGDGIRAARNCIILSNTASNNGAGNSNGAAGIHITGNGNRIEGNNATDNTSTGFLVDANAGNLVIRNNARGNFFSYIFPQGHINIVGTLVTTSAQLNAANNSNVNISNVD